MCPPMPCLVLFVFVKRISLLCFFTFLILVGVCVCLGIKGSTKWHISTSTPKGDISLFKNPLFSTTTNGSFGLQSCFPLFVTSQIVNSRLWKFDWLAGGENAWLSSARFKIETRCGCFYIIVFLKETDCFQKMLDVIFISSCLIKQH